MTTKQNHHTGQSSRHYIIERVLNILSTSSSSKIIMSSSSSSSPIIIKRIATITCLILSLLFVFQPLLPTTPPNLPTNTNLKNIHPSPSKHHSNLRLAIIIPYVGRHFPAYMSLFTKSAMGSASHVDFLIFHTNTTRTEGITTPDNVKLINVGSLSDMASLFLRVLTSKPDDSWETYRPRMISILSSNFEHYPYSLVEFKPAFGIIFAKYLENYSHWGYSDLDVVWGDLVGWMEDSEWREYDIVTYGYGDQERVYLRGQLTFHKNNNHINNLWQSCTHLSQIDIRYGDVISGRKKITFESAEGCYSHAVLQHDDIRIKYAVKAFTDVDFERDAYVLTMEREEEEEEWVSMVYKFDMMENGGEENGGRLIPLDWYDLHLANRDDIATEAAARQTMVGSLIPLQMHSDTNNKDKPPNCMYWAPRKYQSSICAVTPVSSSDTVYFINGRLFKQRHETSSTAKVKTMALFHFQEWKRSYRETQLSSLSGFNKNVVGYVLSKEGVIPLSKPKNDNKSTTLLPQTQPTQRYCITSIRKPFPPRPIVQECLDYITWKDVHILHHPITIVSSSNDVSKNDVTLTLVLTILASHDDNDVLWDTAMANLIAWGCELPSILLINLVIPTPSDDSLNRLTESHVTNLSQKLSHFSSTHEEMSFQLLLVGVVISIDIPMSRNSLTNMVVDKASTKYILKGLELERGLVLSKEVAFFCKRRVLIEGDDTNGGRVMFLIPQWGLQKEREHDGDDVMSVWDVMDMEDTLSLTSVSELDCDDNNCHSNHHRHNDHDNSSQSTSIHNHIHQLWYEITKMELSGLTLTDEDYTHVYHQKQSLKQSLMELALPSKEHFLRHFDWSPIVIWDKTATFNDIVREVDEFAGYKCFDSLSLVLALLLHGMEVDIIPGAFAISSIPRWKRHVCRQKERQHDGLLSLPSRCEGCYMFETREEEEMGDGGGELILGTIVKEERMRVVKGLLLWDKLDKAGR